MPEYTLTIYNDSIELTCDECGHVNHWASKESTLDEINRQCRPSIHDIGRTFNGGLT
jgi:hypothetical protein